MSSKEITEKIKGLLDEYNTADADRKAFIEKEVKTLYKLLPQRVGYCRECNMRKALSETEPHHPFCSAECHTAWGNRAYGEKKKGERKSIADMQRELHRMAKEEHMKKITNKQQRLIAE